MYTKDGKNIIQYAIGKTATEFIIPNGVEKIEKYAFAFSLFKNVEMPNSVTSVGERAFSSCVLLENVKFSNSLTSIGRYAFYNCGLLSIEVPSTVTSFGEHAFLGCSSLTKVNYLGTIDQWATISFNVNAYSNPLSHTDELYINNELVTDVVLTTAKKVSNFAFYNCDSLTSVTIGQSVTSIGFSSFNNCDSLTSIEIPESVTSIGSNAFYNCTSLTIYCEALEQPADWASDWNPDNRPVYWAGEWEYVDGVPAPINYTKGLEFTLINNDTEYAVSGYTGSSTEVIIPATYNGKPVTEIADSAFYECWNLESVVIPEGITYIGASAFKWCESLTSVAIPSTVTWLGGGAFYQCESLASVTFAENIQLDQINSETFRCCYSLTSVEIPSSVTLLMSGVFYMCPALTNISIPNSVTIIGKDVFYMCTELTSIEIPNSVTSIGEMAFSWCESLTSIEIPSSVTSIGECAFGECYSLTSITIPNSVTIIEDLAFANCDSLTIYCEAQSQPETWSSTWNYGNRPVVWGYNSQPQYTEGLEFTLINNDTEYEVSGYSGSSTEVIIPSTYNGKPVTSIGDFALFGCESLTSIQIPNSIINLGDRAIACCTSLLSITVANDNENYQSVDGNLYTKDGKTLIQYAAGKQDTLFIVPNSVATIGEYAISYCGALTSLVISESVTTIAYFGVSYASNLNSIYCEAESQPAGWDSDWNPDNCQKYWSGEWEYVDGVPMPYVEISTAEQFIDAINNPYSCCILTNNITITSEQLGGNVVAGGNVFDSFYGEIDGNGYNLTFNIAATGYFTGVFNEFYGTIKKANIIIYAATPLNGGHGNGVLTNYFDGVIDGCAINFANKSHGGAYGYGYVSLLGTMGENAVLKNSIINATYADSYLEGGIIAEYASEYSQILNVAVVSNKLHYPTKYLGKVLPNDYLTIEGLYVTDSLNDLVAGTADYELDLAKYELWEEDSFQFAYGSGLNADAMYRENASITIADILGREVERGNAPILTVNGGAFMDVLGATLDPALVEITMNDEIIAITQGDEPVALSVTVTYDGVAVDPSLLSWSTSDPSVVSVTAGKVTGVGAGQAYVYASYLGVMSEGCLVDVEALVVEVTDEADFVATALSGSYTYKLTQDLTFTDIYIDAENGNVARGSYAFGSAFYGSIDGDGHTITFNIDSTDYSYFNGMFQNVYGVIKNTNFVLNLTSPHNGSHERGVLIYRLHGTIDNCTINVTNKMNGGVGYGYWAPIARMYENAQVKNTIINLRDCYLAGGSVAEYVATTSKITNVAIVNNSLGWAEMELNCVLPGQGKCDIQGLYVYDVQGANTAEAVAAKLAAPAGYSVTLDEAKYQAEGAPNNITWTTSNCAESNIDVLYTKGVSKDINTIVSGFALEVYDAEILKVGGATTIPAIKLLAI